MAAPSVKVSGYERAGGVVVSEYERAPPGSKRDGQQESTRDDQQQQQQGTKREAETPDRDAEDKPAADAPSENQRKRPTLTVEQYLAMSLAEQQEELVRRAVGNDPEKKSLVNSDTKANMPPPPPPGRSTFLADLERSAEEAGLADNATVRSIREQARQGLYDDVNPSSWGKESLRSHLFMAGLFDLANDIVTMKYKF